MSEIAIYLQNVSKCFKRYSRPVERLKEIILPDQSRINDFWALKDINLEIPKGQTVGIIGQNGSGKSTLLQIIAGTLKPTTGEVQVKGRLSALLELGSGFNPEFTGRQNVFFNARLLGLSQKEIEDKFDEIAGFADIGDFIDQPVKTYSSGMFVRLAFAVAVNVNPEILIVDEALAVGDVVFQHRCMRRMRALMDSGVTTLFVSHDSGAIKTLCNSAILIHQGKIYTSGLPNAVIIEYLKMVTEIELGLAQNEAQAQTHPEQTETEIDNHQQTANVEPQSNESSIQSYAEPRNPSRRGSGQAIIESIKLLNQFGEQPNESPIFEFDEEVTLVAKVKVNQPLPECIIGFFICDKNGNEILGSNTYEENHLTGAVSPGDIVEVQFKFRLPLRPSSYSLTVAGAESIYTAMPFDWIDNAMIFQVLPPDTGKRIHALVYQPLNVSISQSKVSNLNNV